MTGILSMIGARGIAAVLAISLAWFVAPDIYGQYGRVQLIALALLVVLCLRLERAILSAPLREALRMTAACGVIVAVLVLPLSFVFGWLVPELFSDGGLFWLLAAALASKGLVLLATTWMLRGASLAMLAAAIGVQAIVQFTVQIMLIRLQVSGGALHALLMGEATGACGFLLVAWLQEKRTLGLMLRARRLFRSVKRWLHLPLYDLPASFLSQALLVMPLISIGRHIEPEITGHIALALRLTDAPMLLAATVATSWAIRARLWENTDKALKARARFDAIYMVLLIAGAVAILGALIIARLLEVDPRWLQTMAYGVFTLALSLSVASGGPYADLVIQINCPRQVLIVHATAFVCGLGIALLPVSPPIALLLFAGLVLARSLALRQLLAMRGRN